MGAGEAGVETPVGFSGGGSAVGVAGCGQGHHQQGSAWRHHLRLSAHQRPFPVFLSAEVPAAASLHSPSSRAFTCFPSPEFLLNFLSENVSPLIFSLGFK